MTKKRQADAADDEEIMSDEVVEDDLLADEPTAVREELRRLLKNEGARVAYRTMVSVAQDPKAQASARATCAVALFRGAGFLGKKADDEDANEGKPIEQMTIPEMDRELKRLRAERKRNERIIGSASSDEAGEDEEDEDPVGGALD